MIETISGSLICTTCNRKYYHYVQYMVPVFVCFAISLLCLNDWISENIYNLIGGTDCGRDRVDCHRMSLIYRVCLSLSIYYSANLATLLCFVDFYQGYYFIRHVGGLLLLGLSMMLPTIIVSIYAVISFLGGATFLVLSVLVFIDFVFQLEQYFREKGRIQTARLEQGQQEQRESIFHINLGGQSIIIVTLIGNIIFNLMSIWVLYNSRPTSGLNGIISIGTVVINILMTIMVYGICIWSGRWNDHFKLLSCGILTVYNSYLTFILSNNGENTLFQTIMGNYSITTDSILTGVTIIWTSYSIANYHNFINFVARDYDQNIFYVRDQLGIIEHSENISDYHSISYDLGALETYMREMRRLKRSKQMKIFLIVMMLASFSLSNSISGTTYGESQSYQSESAVDLIDLVLINRLMKVVAIFITYVGYISIVALDVATVPVFF